MDGFVQFLRHHTGLSLSKPELLRLYMRYYREDEKKVDYAELVRDLRIGMSDQQAFSNQSYHSISTVQGNLSDVSANMSSSKSSNSNNVRENSSSMSLQQVLDAISDAIQARLPNMSGKDKLKKAYYLMAQNHSSTITFPQLRGACQSRLCCPLSDADLQVVFDHMDYSGNGTVNLREFMDKVMVQHMDRSVQVSLDWSSSAGAKGGSSDQKAANKAAAIQRARAGADAIENATISYDNKYSNITAPDAHKCRYYSVADLELIVRDKIVERCSLNDTLAKTFIRLFGDGSQHNNGSRLLSRDQVKYTFWKKLRLNVSEKDVDRFFEQHEHRPGAGYIVCFELMDTIIKKQAQNEPLLDDNHNAFDHMEKQKVAISFQHNHALSTFFHAMRRCINQLINRESRAPHFLVHSTNRMTVEQAKAFFKSKLKFDVDALFPAAVVEEVLLHRYNTRSSGSSVVGLVDVKRILMEAMSLSAEDEHQPPLQQHQQEQDSTSIFSKSLLNGSLVTVDRMPAALTRQRVNPEEVEQRLREKCNERLKNEHPHATLHKMFLQGMGPQQQLSGGGNERLIDRQGMRKVLRMWDIIMEPEDFDGFFAKHDRGDGNIEIHKFLRRLLPPADLNENPFIPKDPQDARTEMQLSNVLRNYTGKQRAVSYLNGISCNRVVDDFMESVSGHPTAASLYAASARAAAAEVAARSPRSASAGGNRVRSSGGNSRSQRSLRPSSATATATVRGRQQSQLPSSSQNRNSRPTTGSQGLDSPLQLSGSAISYSALLESSLRTAINDLADMSSGSLDGNTPVTAATATAATNNVVNIASTPASGNTEPIAMPATAGSTKLTLRLGTAPSATTINDGAPRRVAADITKQTTQPQQQQQSVTGSDGAGTGSKHKLDDTYNKKQSRLLRELARLYELKDREGNAYAATADNSIPPPMNTHNSQKDDSQKHSALIKFLELQQQKKQQQQAFLHQQQQQQEPQQQRSTEKPVYPARPSSAPNSAARSSPRKQAQQPQSQQQQQVHQTPKGAFLAAAYSTSVLSRPPQPQSAKSSPRSAAYLPRYGDSGHAFTPRSVRSAPVGNSSSINNSPRGLQGHPKYVYTGQKRQSGVNPLGVLLKRQYKISGGLTTTSHEQYGLFVKNLARSVEKRAKLVAKQERTEAAARTVGASAVSTPYSVSGRMQQQLRGREDEDEEDDRVESASAGIVPYLNLPYGDRSTIGTA